MPPEHLQTREQYARLVADYDTFLFDCDGVLWNGDTLVPNVVEVLSYLRSQRKAVLFVTNNATKAREQYKTKFDKLGVQAEVDEIFGSAYASAIYISQILSLPPPRNKVYVIGMSGLERELDLLQIPYIGGTSPQYNTLAPFSLSSHTLDEDVAVVLAGLDTSVNYTKLAVAFQYLRKEGVTFLATNVDSTYPVDGGLLPGAGSIMAPLVEASGRKPLSIGKPGKTMLDCIKAEHEFDPKRTIMIGDRLDTDIEFGRNGGIATLLVLTGVTHKEEVFGPIPSSTVPDYVLNSLGDLKELVT